MYNQKKSNLGGGVGHETKGQESPLDKRTRIPSLEVPRELFSMFTFQYSVVCLSVMLDLRWAPFTFLLKAGVKNRCLVIEPTCIHMLLLDRHLLLTEYLIITKDHE